MTKFESDIKTIKAPQKKIFEVLSDLRNISNHLDKVPEEQLKVERIEEDAVFFKVEMAGEIGIKIIDKEPSKTIKFESVKSPIQFNLWIQLKDVAENETKLKLTLKADLNVMIKAMVSKPIKGFLDKLTDAITSYDYS